MHPFPCLYSTAATMHECKLGTIPCPRVGHEIFGSRDECIGRLYRCVAVDFRAIRGCHDSVGQESAADALNLFEEPLWQAQPGPF